MKTETVEEYIARGGKVDIIPSKGFIPKNQVKVRGSGCVMNLSEASELYGKKQEESEKQKQNREIRVEKAAKAIDLTKIPASLLKELRAMGEKV